MGAYFGALLLPAFYQDKPSEPVLNSGGLAAIGCMACPVYFEWFANPLIIYSWVLVSRYQLLKATYVSILAAGLILVFLTRDNMEWYGSGDDANPAITGYGAGYWLRLVSAVSMAIGSGVQLAQDRRTLSRWPKEGFDNVDK